MPRNVRPLAYKWRSADKKSPSFRRVAFWSIVVGVTLGVIAWYTDFGNLLEGVVIVFVSSCFALLFGLAIPALSLEDETYSDHSGSGE